MKRLNQNGAVAILTVVIFSLIVTIVVTAYARITVVEHQESINFDLSTRAYYAAETGVQDAIRDIRANKDNLQNVGRPDECKPSAPDLEFGKLGSSSNLSYTCQLIDVTPVGVVSSTNTEKSNLFELIPSEAIDASDPLTLQVLWSEGGDTVTPVLQPRSEGGDSSKFFPQTVSWNSSRIHPLLRVTIIRVAKGGNTNPDLKRSRFTQHTYFLNPTTEANRTIPEPVIDFEAQKSGEVIQNASCVKSNEVSLLNDGYSCVWNGEMRPKDFDGPDISIDDEDKSRIFISVSSEYGNTDFLFKLIKGEENIVELKDSQAIIDVTAQAGSVFRRVQQRVPLDNNFSQINFGADALVAGKGICKHFKITDNPDDFIANCVTTGP